MQATPAGYEFSRWFWRKYPPPTPTTVSQEFWNYWRRWPGETRYAMTTAMNGEQIHAVAEALDIRPWRDAIWCTLNTLGILVLAWEAQR